MHIVTTGSPFIDIDAYASMVALAALFREQGREALAASNTTWNASVPPSLRALPVQFKAGYQPAPDDVFALVDISEPEYFDTMVVLDRVETVIDHHPGFEEYWKKQGTGKAQIEFVGAAATLVYERWAKAGLADKLDPNCARLLACGVLDNTLNLKAHITTDRDKTAYAAVARLASLPEDWPQQYFRECQEYILADSGQAISHDAKVLQYPGLAHKTYVGQLTLWDAEEFIREQRDAIRDVLSAKDLPWYMNFIDIGSTKSVFFCEDKGLQAWLASLLGVTFEEDLAAADRLWLRKEIMKRAIEKGDKP